MGLHAAPRRRSAVRGPSRRRLPRRREKPLRRRDRGVRPEPPILRREHSGARHRPPRPGRARARGHRLRAALLPVRAPLPPDGPRPDPASDRGPAAHPHPHPPPLRRCAPGRAGHPRVQPHPLRRLGPRRPAHHRRAARLRPRRIVVPSRGARHPVPGSGREPDPPGGGDRAGLPERDHRLLAGMGAAPARAARMAGGGDPGRDHPQALLVRGDRRDHRGDDHVGARGAQLGPQLGLPPLLGARRLLRDSGPQRARGGGHPGELPSLRAQSRRCGERRPHPAGVGDRSAPVPSRTDRRRVARIPGHGAGALRQ